MNTNYNSTARNRLLQVAVVVSLCALCVVCGGLFLNSHPAHQQSDSDNSPAHFTRPVELPDKADFAGEAVPLDNFDTRESLDRELLVNSNFHSQTLLLLKKAPRYFSIIEPILKEEGIPDDFKYLAVAESGFNERIVSPAGAAGLWQFMKSAAIENGLEVNNEVDERYHIEKSTRAACKYLKKSYARYGSWTMVAASYNAGISGVSRQAERQDSKSYYDLLLNDETARYVFRIVSLKLILQQPEKFGFQVKEDQKYPLLKTETVELKGTVENFTQYAHKLGINYKILKYFNPWLRQSYLKNPSGKTYVIKVPEKGLRKFAWEENSGNF